MARLNIESKLWADPRFQELLIKVGNRHTAKGMVLELWTLAQDAWFPDRKLITRDAFSRAGLGHLLDVGLAESRDGGLYAVGSEEAFAWLFQKQDAGRASGESKRKKRPRKPTHVERPLTDDEQALNARQRNQTSSSSSLSISSSGSPSSNFPTQEKIGSGEAGEGVRRAVWEAYADGYLVRHKVTPTRAAKENSLIKTYCQRVPAAEAAEIARYYVMSHNDALYVRARHPLDLLLRDYQRIRADWLAGQQMTGGKARAAEQLQDIHDVWAPLIAKAEAKDASR